MIKYHDNRNGRQYGEDHMLTNNWNPDSDYGNEYASVYFRIDTKGYGYPSFSFNEEDRALFDTEIVKVFTSLGWKCKESAYNGSCATWTNGNSHLYLHPQNFSGEVLKNDVKKIAEALEDNSSFKLRWVDIYDTVYDLTDEEYEVLLSKKDEDITSAVLSSCKTTRTYMYCDANTVVEKLADKFRLKRVGKKAPFGDKQTCEHIQKIVDSLITEGYLIKEESHGSVYIRTLNKSEQKKKKKKLVVA